MFGTRPLNRSLREGGRRLERKRTLRADTAGVNREARMVQNSTKSLQNSAFSGYPPTRALLGWCRVYWRALWVTVQNEIATPLRCTTPPLAGLKARGKLARDDSLLRYVAGFFMRWEYKETERGCRSPGARRNTHPPHFVRPPLSEIEGERA